MPIERNTQPALPERLSEYLNEAQLRTIEKMEGFGWKLFFIRRPLFQETITIMQSPDCQETSLIETDGNFIQSHDVYIRPSRAEVA